MEKYITPEVEVVEFDENDIVTASPCNGFVCEVDYGNICDGRPISGQ